MRTAIGPLVLALAAPVLAAEGPLVGVLVSGRVVDVTARFEGAVVEVNASLGEPVEAGAVLARIESREVAEDLAAAAAAVTAANAEAEHARERHGRLRSLQGLVADQDLADALLAEQLARAAAKAARARLADLDERAGGARVRAPFTGIVARRDVEAGARVGPGAPIVRLLDPDEVRVRFAIDDESARFLVAGAPLSVIPAPGSAWRPEGGAVRGTVQGIAPDRDPVVGLRPVEAWLEADPATLPLGLEVRVVLGPEPAEADR